MIPVITVGSLEDLSRQRELEVSSGVMLKCGEEINLSIFQRDGNTVIKFGSPAVHVHISKMGPLNLVNALRPTVEEIVITKSSYKIKLDNAPDIEVSRE
jgi:hypothetical protein